MTQPHYSPEVRDEVPHNISELCLAIRGAVSFVHEELGLALTGRDIGSAFLTCLVALYRQELVSAVAAGDADYERVTRDVLRGAAEFLHRLADTPLDNIEQTLTLYMRAQGSVS